MKIEKVKDIIDVNLLDKGLVKVTYSNSTDETIEVNVLVNSINVLRYDILEVNERLENILEKIVNQSIELNQLIS